MDRFINRVVDDIISTLREQYPNGYEIGMKVTVPLNSVARVEAFINTIEASGGYGVKGTNPFDPWGRWVRTSDIVPYGIPKLIDEYAITKPSMRREIYDRVKEKYNNKQN